MNENLKTLNKILLSSNVKDKFYDCYNNDYEFKNWLLGILPEIENCRLQKQNNPWHIYSVLDHILVATQEINKLTTNLNDKERKLLSYIMFFHDTGKPQSHKIKIDENGLEKDTFYNHNIAGEKIVSRAISNFGFNQAESSIIRKLVYDHDFFMYLIKEGDLTSNKLLFMADEKIKDLNKFGDGNKLNQMLIMIGLADNLAQNPLLTKPSIELIKQYETISNNLATPNLIK